MSYVTRSCHDKEVEIPSYSALLEMLNQGFPNKLLIVSVYTVGAINALAVILLVVVAPLSVTDWRVSASGEEEEIST